MDWLNKFREFIVFFIFHLFFVFFSVKVLYAIFIVNNVCINFIMKRWMKEDCFREAKSDFLDIWGRDGFELGVKEI